MKLLNFKKKIGKIRCYPYCLGLEYNREIGITHEQWEKADVNVIAELMVKDLEKLEVTCKIVDKTYTPATKENLLALKLGIMYMNDDYIYCVGYHVIVKRQDGFWYSKFGLLSPERLPFNTDIESWNWRDSNNNVPQHLYSSNIVYIAFQC